MNPTSVTSVAQTGGRAATVENHGCLRPCAEISSDKVYVISDWHLLFGPPSCTRRIDHPRVQYLTSHRGQSPDEIWLTCV